MCGVVDNTCYLTFLRHCGAMGHRTLVSMPCERAAEHTGGRAGEHLHCSHFPRQMQVLAGTVGGGRVSSPLLGAGTVFSGKNRGSITTDEVGSSSPEDVCSQTLFN